MNKRVVWREKTLYLCTVKQQKAAEERPLQFEVYTSADIMADKFAIQSAKTGNDEIVGFDALVLNLIKPMANTLGVYARPCMYVGEVLGASISRGIDKIFDSFFYNENDTKNNHI